MNCAFDKEKLSGYYDGELDAAEKAEVERHIASCSECLRELGELKSAAILVKELPRLRAPRSIAEGISKEIQAAGRVHSFGRLRRTVMWAASAAAVLFIGLNVVYFSAKTEQPAAEVAKTVSPAPALGRAVPAEEPAPVEGERQGAAPERAQERLRADEARRNELAPSERKKLDAAPAGKAEAESKDREKAAVPKVEEKKPDVLAEAPAPAPKPTVAKPAEPPAPAAPPPPSAPATAAARPMKEESKASEAPMDKAAAKRDSDAVGGLKQKSAQAGPVPAADPAGPTHLTLASTQMAKSRPEMEAALKRMGLTLPPPPSAAMVKGVARSGAREETVYTFELTEAQIARLRADLEKPGTSTLVTGRPEDPVMAQFQRGGVFEPKKDVASGGAPAKKFGDSKADAPKAEAPKEKDGKEAGEAFKATAESAQEPRRKVVIHFQEVPFMPDRQRALDALKK